MLYKAIMKAIFEVNGVLEVAAKTVALNTSWDVKREKSSKMRKGWSWFLSILSKQWLITYEKEGWNKHVEGA